MCLGIWVGTPFEADRIDVTLGRAMKATKCGSLGSLDEFLTTLVIATGSKFGAAIGEEGQGSHDTLAVGGDLGRGDAFAGTQLESLGVVTSDTAILALLSTILGGNSMDHIAICRDGNFVNVHVIAIIKVGPTTTTSSKGWRLRKLGTFLLFVPIRAVIVLLFLG